MWWLLSDKGDEMKMHRFIASTNQKAIAKIHEVLGPDALIYSTKSIPDGVEF